VSDILEGSIRWIAQKFMPEFARLGNSARSLDRMLKENYGGSYRWTNLLEDYRKYTGFVKQEKAFRSIGDDALIKRGNMVGVEIGRPYHYRWYADATYVNDATGEQVSKFISGYTDTNPTKSEWESEWSKMFAEEETYSGWRVSSLTFRGAEYNTKLFK
jgi:hypothetical protein